MLKPTTRPNFTETNTLLLLFDCKTLNMSKPIIKIDVVSDVVCPWCYIGKRRLESAIQNVSDEFDFEVQYLPFELNSQMPPSGADNKQYLSKKFGSEDRYHQIIKQVSDVAATEGLSFNFDKQSIAPNTRKAHAMIGIASMQGKQLALVEALFKAYFTEGVNLSDDANLIKLGESVGLTRGEIESAINNPTMLSQIEKQEDQLHQLGVSGVPFYIINNKYGVSGAQTSEVFINAFREISKSEPLVESGDSCDVDSKEC